MKCQCGDVVAKRTARGGENAGKQYFCCDKPQGSKCAFFAWATGNHARARAGSKKPRVQFCQPPFQRLFFQVTASVLPPAVLTIPGMRQTMPDTYVFPMKSYDRVMHMLGDDCDSIPSWVHRMVLSKPDLGMDAEEIKTALESLPEQILPYQREGIAYALQCGARCLFGDEMGLGKSLQALFTLSFFRDEWPVLIVCPSSLRFAWRDQAIQWLGLEAGNIQVVFSGKDSYRADAKIVVISYDLLRRNEAKFAHRAVDGSSFLATIIDECHYIKDFKSQRTKVVQQVCKSARRCLMLSGTPAVNRAIELYTQLVALVPTLMPSLTQYAERYCEKEVQTFGRRQIEKWVGAKRQDELHTILTSTCMIRRKKSDVLTQLPPKRRMRVSLDPQKMDASKLKLVIAKVNEFEHFDPNEPPPQVSELFKQTAEAKMGATLDYVEYLLESTGKEQKMLIFGHHHCTLDGLCAALEGKVGFISIDGRTAHHKRADSVKQFQEDPCCRIAVLSITACGTGLTLTAASLVVFAELYWVPGQLQQAEDRAHRIGQESMVTVQYLIAENTLDERIFDSVNKKALDTSGILDGKHGKCGLRVESSVGVNTPLRGAKSGKRSNSGTPRKINLEQLAFDDNIIVLPDTAPDTDNNPEVERNIKHSTLDDTARALEENIGNSEAADPSARFPVASASIPDGVLGAAPSRTRQLADYHNDPTPLPSASALTGLQKHRCDTSLPPVTPKKRGRPYGPASRRNAASKKNAAAAVTAATLAANLCASPGNSSSSSIAVPPDVMLRANDVFAFQPHICPNLGDLFCRFVARVRKIAGTTTPLEQNVRIGRWFSCQYQILVMSLRFNGALNPNVLAERAARRYMMEFSGKKKSVLRALLENGRFPHTGALLEIVRIHHTPGRHVVELTDGWYIVPCDANSLLFPFLLEGARIRVLELTRLSDASVSPLDLTADVPALRMHWNATSAMDGSQSSGRLGRCRGSHPGSLRCADIHPDGGLVSRMDVTCVRPLPSLQRSTIENDTCEQRMLCVDTFDDCPAEAEFFIVTCVRCSPIASGARIILSHVYPSRCSNGVLYVHAPTPSCIHVLASTKPPAIEAWQPPLFPSDKAISRSASGVSLQFTQRARAGNIVDLRGILLHVEPLGPNTEMTSTHAHSVHMSAFYVLSTPASLICYVTAPQSSVPLLSNGTTHALGHDIAWDVVCFKHHDARPMGVFFDVFHFVALGHAPQCGAPQFALCDEWRAHLGLLVLNARLPRDGEFTPRNATRECNDNNVSTPPLMQTPNGITRCSPATHPTVSPSIQSRRTGAVVHPSRRGPLHMSECVDLPINTSKSGPHAASHGVTCPRAAGPLDLSAVLPHEPSCAENPGERCVLKVTSNGPLTSSTTSALSEPCAPETPLARDSTLALEAPRFTPAVQATGSTLALPTHGASPAARTIGSTSTSQTRGFTPVRSRNDHTMTLPTRAFTPVRSTSGSTSAVPTHGFTPATPAYSSTSALPMRGFAPVTHASGSIPGLLTRSFTPATPGHGSASALPVNTFTPTTPTRRSPSASPVHSSTSALSACLSAAARPGEPFTPATPAPGPTLAAQARGPASITSGGSIAPDRPNPHVVPPVAHSTVILSVSGSNSAVAPLGGVCNGQAAHGTMSPRFFSTRARPATTPISPAPSPSAQTFGTLSRATSLSPAPSNAQNARVHCSRPPTPVLQHHHSPRAVPSLQLDGTGESSPYRGSARNVAGFTMNTRSSGSSGVPNYATPRPRSCMNETICDGHSRRARKRVIDCTESPVHTAKKSCL